MPLLEKYSLVNTAKLVELPNRSLTRIGGMIAAVTHGFSKKSGKPYSMVTLEDLEGSVQLLVMNDYDKFRPLLEANKAILVIGEVSTGEDKPKIFPQEIMPLTDAPKKFTKQVHLRLHSAHLQPEDLACTYRRTSVPRPLLSMCVRCSKSRTIRLGPGSSWPTSMLSCWSTPETKRPEQWTTMKSS